MAILFQPDFSIASPYGFSGNFDAEDGTYFHLTRSLSGGPGNRPYVNATNLVVGDIHQFYAGWSKTGLASVADGVSRFARCYLRVRSPFNATGNDDPWTSKWAMIGDQGGAAENRVIAQLATRIDDTDIQLRITKNIGPVPDEGTTDYNLTSLINTWIALQYEARPGSGTGYIKLWVNNDTFGSPSRSSSLFTISGANWTSYDIGPAGFYNNASTAAGGSVIIDIAKIEYADSFDSSWFANMGSGDLPATEYIKSFGVLTVEAQSYNG